VCVSITSLPIKKARARVVFTCSMMYSCKKYLSDSKFRGRGGKGLQHRTVRLECGIRQHQVDRLQLEISAVRLEISTRGCSTSLSRELPLAHGVRCAPGTGGAGGVCDADAEAATAVDSTSSSTASSSSSLMSMKPRSL